MAKKFVKPTSSGKAFASKMANIGAAWKKAVTESTKSGFTDLEDGTYLARLCGSEVKESDGGWEYWRTEWIVVDGDAKGEVTSSRNGLGAEGLVFLARYMRQLGVDEDTLDALGSAKDMKAFKEKLAEIGEGLAGQRIGAKIRLKTKGEFQNLSIVKLMELDEEQNAVEPGTAQAADEGANEEAPADEAAAEEATTEEAPAEEGSVEVGSKVSYEFKGNTITGEIVAIKSENDIHVRRDDSGSVVRKKAEDLTLVPAEAAAEESVEEAAEEAVEEEAVSEEPAFSKGDKVRLKVKGVVVTGTIESVNADKGTANVIYQKTRFKNIEFGAMQKLAA